MVTPRGIGTPPPKRPSRGPQWVRMGPSRWQTALVCCAVVVGCVLFFEIMLWLVSR
jgi:hypothetical protein